MKQLRTHQRLHVCSGLLHSGAENRASCEAMAAALSRTTERQTPGDAAGGTHVGGLLFPEEELLP